MITWEINRAKIGRGVLGRELATIFDYRQRLQQYRTDESLAFAHLNHPWITVWYVETQFANLKLIHDGIGYVSFSNLSDNH